MSWTPCESWPARLAPTMWRAMVEASSLLAPAASKTAATRAVSGSGLAVGMRGYTHSAAAPSVEGGEIGAGAGEGGFAVRLFELEDPEAGVRRVGEVAEEAGEVDYAVVLQVAEGAVVAEVGAADVVDVEVDD